MPASNRSTEDGASNEADTGSRGGKKRKRKSQPKPTSKAKGKRQSTKERYAKSRDDAEREGIIPTIPDGGVRDERTHSVDPLDGLPLLVRQALKERWETPAAAKPAIIAALLRPFFNTVQVVTKHGDILDVTASPKLLNELARTILALDQTQYERDNPVAAGQAKGANAPVAISVQSNVLAVKVIREAMQREIGGGNSGLPALAESSAPGGRRFDGQVEVCATSTSNQPGFSGSVADPQLTNLDNGTIPAREESAM